MRLLLLGAFAYPHHQGSQVYFQEQAIALRSSGCEVDLLTYASGRPAARENPESWRALDGFHHSTGARWTAPGSLAAGPSWGKPLADLGLAVALRRALASRTRHGLRYDAILTHNAEATLIASSLARVRHKAHPPIIYCVHTLMGQELSSYSNLLKPKALSSDPNRAGGPEEAPARRRRLLARVIDRAGSGLDRALARRVNGWIALTQSARRVMRSGSVAPGTLVPPPIPDPLVGSLALDPALAAARHGLEPESFYLYSGNLDGYQELEILRAATTGRGPDLAPIVVASHDPRVLEPARFEGSAIRPRLVRSSPEMLGLMAAARASLVMRRAEGGFPIKLANSLALGTAPITFLEREWGLNDGENAWVVSAERPATGLREAIADIDRNPADVMRRSRGARALYEQNHRPAVAAERTLALIEQVLDARD